MSLEIIPKSSSGIIGKPRMSGSFEIELDLLPRVSLCHIWPRDIDYVGRPHVCHTVDIDILELIC